jgi:hypothetical protein
MAAPIINSRTPSSSQTEVYLNQLIYVVFDQSLDSTTLNDNTIILYRTSDYAVLDKVITYDSNTFTVTVTPDIIFDKNTTYNVVVVGADQSSTCVKNASGESLATTATWYFTTGDEIYEEPQLEQPEAEPEEEVADSPVVKVLEPRVTTDFNVFGTSPENYETNLGTINSDNATVYWSGPITITFNKPVASGTTVDQNWVVLTAEAVDGDPSTTTYVPSGVLSSGAGYTLTWTPYEYDSNQYNWRVNNEITVTLSEDIQDYEGNTLGDAYQFMFTMAYRPLYCTVKKIRTAIGPYIRDVNDDAINRLIYQNSLEAYNIANEVYAQNQWTIDEPTFAAKMWVCCKTQYDLLYAKLLDAASCGPGEIKRLGDFTIQESTAMADGLKGALQKALDCMNAWMKQLLGKYRRAKAKMVVKGVSAATTPPIRGVRTWSVPGAGEGIGANKRASRAAKSPTPYSEWS